MEGGLPKKCYGAYIAKKYVEGVLGVGSLLLTYTIPCAAVTLACGFATGDWAGMVGDALGTCTIPVVLAPAMERSALESLRETGELAVGIPIAQGAAGLIGGAAVYAAYSPGLRRLYTLYLEGRWRRAPGIGLDVEKYLEAYSKALFGNSSALEAILGRSKSVEEALLKTRLAKAIYDKLTDKGLREKFAENLAERGDAIEALKEIEGIERVKDKVQAALRQALKLDTEVKVTEKGEVEIKVKGEKIESDAGAIEKVAERGEKAVEEAAEEAEKTLERAAKHAKPEKPESLGRKMLRGLACSLAGALAGTLTHYHYLNPAGPLRALHIKIENNKIIVGNIEVGQ